MHTLAGRLSAGLAALVLIGSASFATAQTPPAQNVPPGPAAPMTPKGPPAAAAPTTSGATAGSPVEPGARVRPHRSAVRRHVFRGDIAAFAPGELRAWRGGEWRHTAHAGRYGWWWVVDGGWYYYPAPVYPYPDYITDEYYEADEYASPYPPEPPYPSPGSYPPAEPYVPNEPSYGSYAPAEPYPPTTPYAMTSSYYCDYPAGYYPYVRSCAYPWRTVPARPPY